MVQASYTNKRGKSINISISLHAKQRFLERWMRLNPGYTMDWNTLDEIIAGLFRTATRKEHMSGKDQTRLKRHGEDTLYFCTPLYTFVVQDATIVTVEISENAKRYLNRIPASEVQISILQ